MFWKRLASSAVLVVLALIFLILGLTCAGYRVYGTFTDRIS